MILGIWPSLYGIRQRTYENPDPHRQLRTAASPPDRPPRTTIATRRAARREERNESGRPNRADDRPQPGELRDRTPPPWRTWDARSFAGARTDVSGRADQTTATPRPATIDIRRGL